ncbi:class I SAM-dependent methyltransferase [Sulfurimonas sp.]
MTEVNNWNANKYNKGVDFVSKLALPVVKLLNPKKGEDILDLGCGDGSLAIEIKKYGAKVIGIDLSADMISKSREKGLEAYVMSLTDLELSKKFDAVFSNAVLHWVKDATSAVEEVHKVLKPNGRFVGEFGGDGNVEILIDAIQKVFTKHPEYGEFQNPWYFPSTKEYKYILQKSGFIVKQTKLIKRPTPVNDIKEWLDIFANGIMRNIPQEFHDNFKNEVQNILKPQLYSKKDGWVVDYVRLRFFASKVAQNA